jgi:6-phosphogluconolactonase
MHGKGTILASRHIERREMLAAGLYGATLMVLPSAAPQAAETSKPSYVYVGSYTKNPPGGGSNNPIGLSVFRFDPQSGALTPVQQVPSANPSFVALYPSGRFLYVVNDR